MSIPVLITKDEFGTFRYEFTFGETRHECFDFPDEHDAFEGANFHHQCLVNGWPHEVCDSIGAIFRPTEPRLQSNL